MTDLLTLPNYGPGPVYTGQDIWLPLMVVPDQAIEQTGPIIQGRSFIDCRLRGPAVILPLSGCSFDACNMGGSDNDIRNLMLSPLGSTKVTGVIAFRDCKFLRCDFISIGFTGGPEFLDELSKIGELPA